MGLVKTVAGVAITVVIGGTAYTVNKADVVNNFANDTGLTQQEAEQYVNSISKEDLVSYDKVGSSYIQDGNTILKTVAGIDCINYTYEWVSTTLSCERGKTQMYEIGNDEVSLGNSYVQLSRENATKSDIQATINYIDEVNNDYTFEIVDRLLDSSLVETAKKTNSYNKATLSTVLNSR